MPFGNSRDESRRDSGAKPRVARNELPWEKRVATNNPNGVAARWWLRDTTPSGLKTVRTPTQGSSFLATLGWRPQSLWDCRTAGPPAVPHGSGLARNIRKALTPNGTLSHSEGERNGVSALTPIPLDGSGVVSPGKQTALIKGRWTGKVKRARNGFPAGGLCPEPPTLRRRLRGPKVRLRANTICFALRRQPCASLRHLSRTFWRELACRDPICAVFPGLRS